jgi:tRNA(His) 5'-end guanylyltransferase
MDSDDFEKRMRASEYFHDLRCLPGTWVVLRLDGRGFTKFTERSNAARTTIDAVCGGLNYKF